MKRAFGFADRALPGFAALWICAAAAVIFMVLTGAFGSGNLPFPQRLSLWTALIGWSLIKWQAWFAWRVRGPGDWPRAVLAGAFLLNLPLPLEIWLALRLVGIDQPPMPIRTWIEAVTISGLIFTVIHAATRKQIRSTDETVTPSPSGPLARARVCPSIVAAIEAEDHYCRLRLTDGSSTLIHARFADAIADVAGIDGARTHRGAWVATRAVLGAERTGRRWLIVLAEGSRVPLSARYAPDARGRGWLKRPASQTR